MSDALFDIEPPAKPVDLVKKPKGRGVADTYEDFIAKAEPAFLKAAKTGRTFTSFEIAEQENIPDPPKAKAQWGGFISHLKAIKVIEQCGWANSKRPGDNSSSVKKWRGTRQMRRSAA